MNQRQRVLYILVAFGVYYISLPFYAIIPTMLFGIAIPLRREWHRNLLEDHT